jgi:hypothetical protein
MSAPAVPRIQRMPLQSSTKSTTAAAPRAKVAAKSAATPPTSVAAVTTPRPTSRPTTPRLPTAAVAAPKLKMPTGKPTSANYTPRSSKPREQSPLQAASSSEPQPQQPTGTPAKRTPRKKSTTPGRHSKPETFVPKDDVLDDACLHCSPEERTSGMLYRAIAVDRHDKGAIFNLGWMHYFGSGGCTRSERVAWSYFSAAAHQGHAMGHYYCGLMRERGLGGQSVNIGSALEHYLVASHEGCDLGSYAAARLTELQALESRDRVLELYEAAAAQGSSQAASRVQQLRQLA